MKNKKFIRTIISIFLITVTLSGCSFTDDMALKLNLRNENFDYIKNDQVDKIVIQNVRDKGFRFIVTDSKAINNIYKILSKGKVKSEKSDLDPDYYFEIKIGDEVRGYNYVVSSESKDKANFYNDEEAFVVPKSLENTIRENLSFIKKPRDFNYIYYQSILKVIDQEKGNLTNDKVGIDINKDVNCLKYVFSAELEDFKNDLTKLVPNNGMVKNNSDGVDENNSDNFDTIITVKNRGFSSTIFKTQITVENKNSNSKIDYYVSAEYSYKNWKIKVSEPNKRPQDW